jgi:hypothetical protein
LASLFPVRTAQQGAACQPIHLMKRQRTLKGDSTYPQSTSLRLEKKPE